MALDGTSLAVVAIIFLSTLVRAVFGFGNALIAMPLLALTSVGMKTATPLVALVATMLSAYILWQDWRSLDLKSTWRLLLATVPGTWVGLVLLKGPYETLGKMVLALIVIAFSLYNLLRPRLFTLRSEWTAYPFGFLAGILGGAYNTNGPPVIIYGTIRRWPPDRFRATLQGYFFPANIIIIAGHGLGGLWTFQVGQLLLLCLPAIILSVWLGDRLNRRLPPAHFERAVHLLLILIGAILLMQTLAA